MYSKWVWMHVQYILTVFSICSSTNVKFHSFFHKHDSFFLTTRKEFVIRYTWRQQSFIEFGDTFTVHFKRQFLSCEFKYTHTHTVSKLYCESSHIHSDYRNTILEIQVTVGTQIKLMCALNRTRILYIHHLYSMCCYEVVTLNKHYTVIYINHVAFIIPPGTVTGTKTIT